MCMIIIVAICFTILSLICAWCFMAIAYVATFLGLVIAFPFVILKGVFCGIKGYLAKTK